MINSSLAYLEKRTNEILFARDKTYLFDECISRVYDYPINTTTLPDGITSQQKSTYTLYSNGGTSVETLTLNVGYTQSTDVPPEIKDAGLQLIKYYYFEAETDKANKGMLPKWLDDTINQLKRFWV